MSFLFWLVQSIVDIRHIYYTLIMEGQWFDGIFTRFNAILVGFSKMTWVLFQNIVILSDRIFHILLQCCASYRCYWTKFPLHLANQNARTVRRSLVVNRPFPSSLCLCFKMSPSAKPFIRNSFLLTSPFKCISNLFSYERFCTWIRFETEEEGNSEMAYCRGANMELVNSASPSSHMLIGQFKRKSSESC